MIGVCLGPDQLTHRRLHYRLGLMRARLRTM
jgi:hypothetical protein